MTHDPAYILCGGRSSRMGEDKARIDLAGQALVQRVARQLAPLSRDVFLVAQEAGRYDDLGLASLGDRTPNLGPLGGLSTALHHRQETFGRGWITLAACDTLLCEPKYLQILIDQAASSEKESLACAWRDTYWHPMPGRYHSDLIPTVDQLLSENILAFQALLNDKGVGACEIPCDESGGPSKLNLNTPQDIEAARKMFGHG